MRSCRPLTVAERAKLRALTADPKIGRHVTRAITQLGRLSADPTNPDLLAATADTVREIEAMRGA